MYESFFEMEHTPFTRDIPVERLYTSPKIENALGRPVYVVDPSDVRGRDGESRMRQVHADTDAGREAWQGKIPAFVPFGFEIDASVAVCGAFRAVGP